MAKVKLVLEDVVNEQGEPTLKMSIESDPNDTDETSLAKQMLAELYSAVIGNASSVRYFSKDGEVTEQVENTEKDLLN